MNEWKEIAILFVLKNIYTYIYILFLSGAVKNKLSLYKYNTKLRHVVSDHKIQNFK